MTTSLSLKAKEWRGPIINQIRGVPSLEVYHVMAENGKSKFLAASTRDTLGPFTMK